MRHLFFILLLFNTLNSYAQIDSTIDLNEVTISSVRGEYQSGLHSENIDSSEITRLNIFSLDQLLTNNTAISIKDYGHGQLSTITLRGGSSYHTAVLWNGFSISSPLHGLTDLTLADNLFFDRATVLYGGASTLWGSGAVSGSIYLDNVPYFNSGLSVSGGGAIGSYSDYTQFAQVTFGNLKYYGSIKYIGNDNRNDFEFYDENNELRNQIHSHLKHHSIFSDHYIKTGTYSTLNFRLWSTFFDREIPPALQQINSNARQKDNNLRLSAEWKKVKEDFQVNVRTAFFSEKEKYDDDYLTEPSNNNSNTFISEALFEKSYRKNSFQFGVNNTINLVDSSVNIKKVNLNRTAVFLLYRYQSENKRVDASLSARMEYSSAGNSPFLYSAGINYSLLKSLVLRTSVSKVFRYPTINDLYWVPGGNTELKPENGYNTECGLQFDPITAFHQTKQAKSILNITFYQREINDWIIWYPSTSTLWKPQNLLKVISKGIETNLTFTYKNKNFSINSILSYNYTLSTNEKSLRPMDESFQKQLIYVPPHTASARFTLTYRTYSFTPSLFYMSYRYTTSDNNHWLKDYTIFNAEVSKIFTFKNVSSKVFLRVNNLTDTSYQSVENRPTPLRTFLGGISVTYGR